MARVHDHNFSFQTFSSIIQLDCNSSSRSTAGFPANCVSFSLSINMSDLTNSSRHSLMTHPFTLQLELPGEDDERTSNQDVSQGSFTNFQVQYSKGEESDEEEQFRWASQESVSSSEQSEEEFDPHDFSFSNQREEEVHNDSPFFGESEGLSALEISSLPIMRWGAMHNKFNKGQKCSVCLQQFKIGCQLRVMACLHRFHVDCLDLWLQSRANCPNCRTKVHPK